MARGRLECKASTGRLTLGPVELRQGKEPGRKLLVALLGAQRARDGEDEMERGLVDGAVAEAAVLPPVVKRWPVQHRVDWTSERVAKISVQPRRAGPGSSRTRTVLDCRARAATRVSAKRREGGERSRTLTSDQVPVQEPVDQRLVEQVGRPVLQRAKRVSRAVARAESWRSGLTSSATASSRKSRPS